MATADRTSTRLRTVPIKVSQRIKTRRRISVLAAWVLTALIAGFYLLLPNGDERVSLPTARESVEEQGEPRRLDIVGVAPSDVSAGSAVTVAFTGAEHDERVAAFVGKTPMEVLTRRQGSLVVRVPAELTPGRVKLRVVEGTERSKPYDLQVKSPNWQKPFRNLVGGFALLLFGISVLAKGAREAAGLRSAQTLARLARRGPSALGFGALIGALVQSTAGAASVLAGLVASSLVAVAPAALAFLGAQIGAATAPLVTGLVDPREGLVLIAIGALWHGLASDRRSNAMGRFVLGAGLIAFGLQTLRPGFEPFVQNPRLLSLISELRADSIGHIAAAASLGALLVALLQGPAPVLILVLVLAETTAQWDLTTALAVLSGSGLGAAMGALVTTPAGRKCRQLATLNLSLGLLATLIAASTVGIWSRVADLVVPGVPHEIQWGRRVLLPNLGVHLAVAFALSQLSSALLLWPLVRPLASWLDRRLPSSSLHNLARIGDPVGVLRNQLGAVVKAYAQALPHLRQLVLEGSRQAGRDAEHVLTDARAALEEVLAGPIFSLPDTLDGRSLSRTAFTTLQLGRALEALSRQAERLVDVRVSASSSGEPSPLPDADSATLTQMHELLSEGIASVFDALSEAKAIDIEHARAREIRMNGLESRARGSVLADQREPGEMRCYLAVLELADAYENVGNQLYRSSESLAENFVRTSAAPARVM
ncbi:MAG TPA: hypothetical protein VFQ61_25070 [Polyangiaceae bacterium]|nr:hypothetical protein [Polyangiaceae bacterium]